MDLDEADRLERADRLADADAADAERLAEPALGRDRVTGLQVAAPDRLEQLVAYRLRAVDRLQGVELRRGGLCSHGPTNLTCRMSVQQGRCSCRSSQCSSGKAARSSRSATWPAPS